MASSSVPLSDVAEVFSGHTLRPGQLGAGAANVWVVHAADLGDNATLNCSPALPSALVEGRAAGNLLRPGDLLLRTRGASNLAVRVIDTQVPTLAVSPLLVLRVIPGAGLDPDYLHWLINSPTMQALLDREARGTTIRMVSAASIRQMPIPLPPLDRQRQVAALADLAQREEEQVRQLQLQRQQFLDQVLWHSAQNTGGLAPPGEKAKAPRGSSSQGLLDRN